MSATYYLKTYNNKYKSYNNERYQQKNYKSYNNKTTNVITIKQQIFGNKS